MKGYTVPTIYTAVDKATSVVNSMADNAASKAAKMERSFRKVGASAENIGKKTAIAGLAILAPLGLAANAAIKFEEKMSNVSTLIDSSVEDIGAMGDEVLKLSTRLPVPIEELTTSLYDIRSAGISAEKQFAALETSAKLSAAGLSTTSESTNILTSAMNAFESEGKSAAEISDILFKTVKFGKTTIAQLSTGFGASAPIIQSAGVQLADFSAAVAALTTVGTPATQAQNQIRAAIVALQKPTKDMEKVFKRLGVTNEKEIIEKFGGTVGAFEAVNKAAGQMGIRVSKVWSSVEASAAVTSLLGATNKAYTDTLHEMVGGANAVDAAFDKQAQTGKAAMQLAKNNIEALTVTIGTQLIPIITSLIQKVSPTIQQFTDWAQANKGTIKTIVTVAAVVGGLLLVISAISFAVAMFTKLIYLQRVGIVALKVATYILTGAQWLLNAAMSANPIALIIIQIAALIGLIALIIVKYEKWGAAVTLLLGPLGMVINLIMSFKRNWDGIVSAFKDGGILAGIKKIGAVLLDSILFPMQQILQLMSNLPGAIGRMAKSGAEGIEKFRANLGVEVGSTSETVKPINPELNRNEMLKETINTNNANVNLNINDPNNRVSAESPYPWVNIMRTSTLQ
jgi:TP901 family phage tail tape measure protein